MGKVYDALRKAEEQRSRRLHEAADAGHAATDFAMPLREEVHAPAPPAGAPAKSVFQRLREAAPAVAEGGDAYNKRRIVMLQPESPIAEQFRSLRARIDALAERRPLRTIAVTSALPKKARRCRRSASPR